MAMAIHGHEVIEMIIQSGKAYTRETLRADILDRFGAETRFYACATENMTADELITFLEDRGKFRDAGAGFTIDQDQVCNH
ncbi:MAG: YecH family metal-binding protein [Candidatus Binatia bacterium]